MNIFKASVWLIAVAIAVFAAAEAPVAVRVEVGSFAAGPEGTEVVLKVQVSPEDRSRIGKNAMVRVTLDGDVPPGQSPLWAVRMEGDGSGRIETVWPPGEHALEVEISNPSGKHTGLWVGTVRIPGADTGAAGAEIETPAPEPTPTPLPKIEGAAATAAAGSAIAASPAADETPVGVSEPIDEETPDQRTSDTGEIPDTDENIETPSEPEIVVEEETELEVAEPATLVEGGPVEDRAGQGGFEPGPTGSGEAAGAVGVAAAAAEEPASEPATAPEPPAADASLSEESGGATEPEAAIVEPLRGDTPQPDLESGPGVVAAPKPSGEDPKPLPAEVAAAIETWTDADPATADLTVIAFDDSKPASGLTPSDFSLRVGGEEALIDEIGGRDRAPLQLGIAVDVETGSGVGWLQSGGQLFSLVQRARAGRGHVFFATGSTVGEWDGGSGDPGGATDTASSGDLTSLIVQSLERFRGRRGRSFLVVVTDGRVDADKTAWKKAEAAAESSGVPVLVVALWDENFSNRVRKNLKNIAGSSGGGLFLVQGGDQLDRAAERFGPMIDAGVAIRFVVPPGVALPAPVSIQATEETFEVTAPEGVR